MVLQNPRTNRRNDYLEVIIYQFLTTTTRRHNEQLSLRSLRLVCDGAPVTINGCQFMCHDKSQVIGITKRCRGAVITNNTCQGNTFVVMRPGALPRTKFQIHSNIAVG